MVTLYTLCLNWDCHPLVSRSPGLLVSNMTIHATRTIKASEFKAKCLRLMDEVAATGEGITVTKRGKPIGKFVPMETPQRPPWGKYSSQLKFAGDVMSPIDVEWEADANPDRVLHPC